MADYAATVGTGLAAAHGRDGQQAGDPNKAAAALYQLVRLPNPPRHLPLGHYAYQTVRAKLQALLAEIDAFAHLGEPTDY